MKKYKAVIKILINFRISNLLNILINKFQSLSILVILYILNQKTFNTSFWWILFRLNIVFLIYSYFSKFFRVDM